MPPLETEFRSALRLLGSHPDDPKMQLRFALGLYAISDLSELLTTVVDGILAVTGMERAYVMLKENEHFDFPVARNKQKANLDLTEFSFSNTIVEQVLKQRKTHYSRDAAALHNMSDSAKRLHLKTILCIPLLIRGFEFEPHAVGVIYADSTKNLIHFSAEQLELFGILGGHAAMAIENARLYKLATVDPLTELHLRHFVMNQLKIEWHAAER
ncbi:MAG TPA: GAF domain-containing protein, partial [Acidobacteriota bacterium]